VTRQRIWDPLVRLAHWTLAGGIAAAWLTRHTEGRIHEWIGYVPLGVVVVRVAWGFVGSRHALFRDFVRSPRATWAYARQVFAAEEPRYLGHNPLGGWMILLLLALALLTAGSGWLYTTDRFWGVAWVDALHRWSTNLLLGAVALHVGGVALASWRHRENLVAAMLHGYKRDDAPRDRQRPRGAVP
jgi:cytochrome b